MKRQSDSAWHSRKGGFTLVEVMFALVILVGALIMAAQALSSSYGSLKLQAQRHAAMRHCQATMGLIRAERAQVTPDVFKTQRLPAWVSTAGVQDRVLAQGAALPEEMILVAVTAQNGPAAVTVTASWTGPNQRPMQARLATLLIEE